MQKMRKLFFLFNYECSRNTFAENDAGRRLQSFVLLVSSVLYLLRTFKDPLVKNHVVDPLSGPNAGIFFLMSCAGPLFFLETLASNFISPNHFPYSKPVRRTQFSLCSFAKDIYANQ